MQYDKFDDVLEKKLEDILRNIDMQKKIFVWGYGEGGEIVYNLLRQKGIMQIEIVDSTYENNSLKIKKPDYLRGVDLNDVIVLLCMKNSREVEDDLEALGFQKEFSYFSMVEQVYGDSEHVLGYRHWIEYRYGLDISANKYNRDGEFVEYAPTPWQSLHKIVESLDIEEKDALFDYGMGKGGVLVWLALEGLFQRLAGVERDEELFRTACENFKKLEIRNVKAICSDARNVTDELDTFNYFFFFNPFLGSVFEAVLLNIVNSYKRKKRRIRMIYINTFCHDTVMASGIFRLEKQIEVKHFIPLANIYTTEI